MRRGLLPALAGTFVVILLGSSAIAQNQPSPAPPPPAQAAVPLTPAQLDQLTAPIALYPDALVGQILMAATYPLGVVEAARWVQQPANASLKGDQLAGALMQQPWDPSVKSLVAFPQILKMMDGNLTWTEQLGDAFLAAQSAVMDSVQRLRQQAETAGKLKSTSQMVVSTVGGAIVIAPPDPNSVYVPVYNPNDMYGAWAYPDYPPDYFPGYFPGVEIGPLGFGWFDVGIIGALWGWDRWDWGGHRIDIDAGRFNALNARHPAIASGAWQHDPSHRGGVPYRDPAVRARFQGAATASRVARGFPAAASAAEAEHGAAAGRPSAPEAERGAAVGRPGAVEGERAPAAGGPPAPQIVRGGARAPAAERRPPPVMQSFGRGPQVRAEAQRGQVSRASAPAPRAAAPAARAAPARSAPAGRGGHR
jgi:hypothetical protein